jgi:hypothetical protein
MKELSSLKKAPKQGSESRASVHPPATSAYFFVSAKRPFAELIHCSEVSGQKSSSSCLHCHLQINV